MTKQIISEGQLRTITRKMKTDRKNHYFKFGFKGRVTLQLNDKYQFCFDFDLNEYVVVSYVMIGGCHSYIETNIFACDTYEKLAEIFEKVFNEEIVD